MNNVEKFIQRFQSQESIKMFSNDCSYWFATILYRRFIRDGAVIVFDNDNKCFGVMIHGAVYNITGKLSNKGKWVPWLSFMDNVEKQRITDKYIMF